MIQRNQRLLNRLNALSDAGLVLLSYLLATWLWLDVISRDQVNLAHIRGLRSGALLAAVKEDFFAGRIGVRRVDDESRWHGGPVEGSLEFCSGDAPEGGYYTVQIALQDTASSTLALSRASPQPQLTTIFSILGICMELL